MTDDAAKPKEAPKPESHTFSFVLEGHGINPTPVGTFTVEAFGKMKGEKAAFKKAFAACRKFELPGWRVKCVETGNSFPVLRTEREHAAEEAKKNAKRARADARMRAAHGRG